MTESMIEVSSEGLFRLQTAAAEFARAEVTRIMRSVIVEMRDQPAHRFFGDVAARHLWDEYCWAMEEGPFDDDIGWDDVGLGSLSGAFEGIVRALIDAEVEKLPRHARVFLSDLAAETSDEVDALDMLGSIWVDGIVTLVLDRLNEQARSRHLDLIGPHRGDVIGHEVSGAGVVRSVLSDSAEPMDILAAHVDAMIDPTADLSDVAAALMDAFLAVTQEDESAILPALLDSFGKEIGALLPEQDVLPTLAGMSEELLVRLDGTPWMPSAAENATCGVLPAVRPQHELRHDRPQPGPNRGNAGKGSRNRTTSAAKAIIEDAVERPGGAERLLAWVRGSPENERVFWSSIFPKLLPLQVTGKDEEPVKVSSHVLIVPAKDPDDTVVRPLRPAEQDR